MGHVAFLELARSLGLCLVQIADNLPLHPLSSREMEELRDRARAWGIEMEVGTRGLQPENLARYREIARFFHSPILRVVIDAADFRPDREEILGILSRELPHFAERDITLAIENHDRFKARELASIVEAADNPAVGICLDMANSLGALEGVDQVVDALLPHVVNLHVKDVRIERLDHAMGFFVEGTPAGRGMLDTPGIVERIRRRERETGRTCNAILELWPPPEADIGKTIEKEQSWIRESVGYLRTLIED